MQRCSSDFGPIVHLRSANSYRDRDAVRVTDRRAIIGGSVELAFVVGPEAAAVSG
jgi:hypothetical protein